MQNKNHRQLIISTRKWYKTIKSIYCPALSANIIFNSKGFRHLLYNGLGHARDKKESVRRFELLPSVIEIIKKAKNISEYRSESNVGSKDSIEYWSIKETSEHGRTTIILRRIGNDNIAFYSVWRKK